MKLRSLGKTGVPVSVLGIGDVADRTVPLEQCVATLRRAMDQGLNLVDTAPGYEDGYSEQDAVLRAYETFHPLPPEAMQAIAQRAALATEGKGTCWWNP
jgi:aryl-alcohol dehydrogenase-like predicted oxidoreductase